MTYCQYNSVADVAEDLTIRTVSFSSCAGIAQADVYVTECNTPKKTRNCCPSTTVIAAGIGSLRAANPAPVRTCS
jgi:hypothetical protein